MLKNDYAKLAEEGMSAEQLADVFMQDYFAGKEIKFPINAFQILTDLKIPFCFRPFKSYDGIYIPQENENDFPVIGININHPITRQRFSAAHELCHHLKDKNRLSICKANSRSYIETYAERFAGELLMPTAVLKEQVSLYELNGHISMIDILKVADYFGVSFRACLNKIAYELHMIEGDISATELKNRSSKFKPQIKRKELKMYDVHLYEQLFDALGDNINITPTEHMRQRFKTEYVFNDSRMEGVKIEIEKVGDIVEDLRRLKNKSEFCKEENQNIIEVAGLTLVYDYAFKNAESDFTIYDAKHLNKLLYSTAPYSEYGGSYRQSNAVVSKAGFETVDYGRISTEMYYLDQDLKDLMTRFDTISCSQYIEEVVRFHHRMTIIHAFKDGNGRTSRAFSNMMLLRKHLPAVFFDEKGKKNIKMH